MKNSIFLCTAISVFIFSTSNASAMERQCYGAYKLYNPLTNGSINIGGNLNKDHFRKSNM